MDFQKLRSMESKNGAGMMVHKDYFVDLQTRHGLTVEGILVRHLVKGWACTILPLTPSRLRLLQPPRHNDAKLSDNFNCRVFLVQIHMPALMPDAGHYLTVFYPSATLPQASGCSLHTDALPTDALEVENPV